MQIELFTALKSAKVNDCAAKAAVEALDASIDRRMDMSVQAVRNELVSMNAKIEGVKSEIHTVRTGYDSVRTQLTILTALVAVIGLIGVTAPIWSRLLP